MSDSALDQSFDAIVVGSGMGGSAVALRLAQAGQKVLVIERGRQIPSSAEADVNPFIYHRHAVDDDLRQVGGRSKWYGAALYRFREVDFQRRAHEDGTSPAWPLRYADLEPYYTDAEALYRVHGNATNDASEPWRSAPYPFPPIPDDPVVGRVAARLERRGLAVSPIPLGIDYGPGGACVLCAACDSHHCRFEAKMDAETAALRPALQTGNVALLSETDCLRVLLDATGTSATGVEIERAGETRKLSAPTVVVAGGYPFSSLLLRRSRCEGHSEGVGNHSGWLGRGVAAHSTGQVFPVLGLRPLGKRHTKTFAINRWFDGDADWPHPLGVAQIAGQTPFWDLAGPLKRPFVRAVAHRSLMVFHMTEALPDKSTGWAFDGEALGAFTPPRHQSASYEELRRRLVAGFRRAGYPVITPKREVAFWHETGGAIMGTDPAHSVVSPIGQVHGISNLFVADATVLPSASSVNTGLTIVALALRTADAILGRIT